LIQLWIEVSSPRPTPIPTTRRRRTS